MALNLELPDASGLAPMTFLVPLAPAAMSTSPYPSPQAERGLIGCYIYFFTDSEIPILELGQERILSPISGRARVR